MIKFKKLLFKYASLLLTIAYTIIPEKLFPFIQLSIISSEEINIIINRIIFAIIVILIISIVILIYMKYHTKEFIKGHNYTIQVEYGNIFDIKNVKRIISFDECFTTKVGDLPSEIKENSICGQYLLRNPDLNISELIKKVKLSKCDTNSRFDNKIRYESGRIVPNGDDLLLAFANLDENGLSVFFSYNDFINCLSVLWEEIDKYYAQKDVCIPILGSGLTRIGELQFTPQELIDIIIKSYKLSIHKIKNPYKLRIICYKNNSNEISLNQIKEL